MDFNDTNIYTYFTKPYAYGWMVYHIENGEHVMDMCYATEEVAKNDALQRNMREAKRVAEAQERIENYRKNLVVETLEHGYYGVRGRYYGD